ncbi:hypothetical protein QYF36_016305 [Acer negundo]|nr:hypothetical protein QYF36_016305 [Acer negundo]
MDADNSFKSYIKANRLEEQAYRRRTRKRLIIITLSFIVLITIITGALVDDQDHRNEEDLVSAACSRTFYVDICVSSIRSDPRSSTISDLRGLADVALNVTFVLGMETL